MDAGNTSINLAPKNSLCKIWIERLGVVPSWILVRNAA